MRPYQNCVRFGRLGPGFANPASLGATQDKGYAEASEATLPKFCSADIFCGLPREKFTDLKLDFFGLYCAL
jgi:hypothetical protein